MLHRHRFTTSETQDAAIFDELVAILEPHPAGLRRWSVMNAVRKARRSSGRDIPLKLETDVERIFRRYCAAEGARDPGFARFRRPPETAGEVWALNPAWSPPPQGDAA
ncbi:MAG TPA: hypothetical protein VG821_09775 [Rhizomicrobium sp.]|jgi:hypothetical protein|nr:hypothetical protein [Rhizomicrobium sp.]